MCHYITCTLPASVPWEPVDRIARAHHRRLRPLQNASIEARIGSQRRYFATTTGMCDCGLPFGFRLRAPGETRDSQATAQRLAKKGWSLARIQRALQQMAAAGERTAAQVESSVQEAASNWIQLVNAVLASGLTPEFGLLYHWYRGGLDESMAIELQPVALGALDLGLLGTLREDTLYLFRPD